MTSDLQKYRANMFQIAGLSLMTPVGKLVLDFLKFSLSDLNLQFLAYVIFSSFLFYVGIIFLFKGDEILERRDK